MHKSLQDQLIEADEAYKKVKELEELVKRHNEINALLRDKVKAALKKQGNGELVNEEQAEIDDIAKQQEDAYRKMSDKVLKNNGC